MFKSLQDYFSNKVMKTKSDGQPSDEDIKLAAASLMFEVIRCDGQIDSAELGTMTDILRRQFAMADDDIKEMLAVARAHSSQATCLHQFTRDICKAWDNTQRVRLVEHLWLIALADERIDTHERHLVRKVAGLLYLSERQIAQSRESAKGLMRALNRG